MKKYNCVVVFDAEKQNILFCKRIKIRIRDCIISPAIVDYLVSKGITAVMFAVGENVEKFLMKLSMPLGQV